MNDLMAGMGFTTDLQFSSGVGDTCTPMIEAEDLGTPAPPALDIILLGYYGPDMAIASISRGEGENVSMT